jgi:hypothetical protein
MTRFLLAGAAAFGMMTSAVMAQSSASQTTTTTVPSGPVVISSSATTGGEVRADGDLAVRSGTMSRDSSGNVTESTITNTTYPLTNMITTTKKTSNTVNGVTTETVTTTQTYPPVVGRPDVPPVTTTTRTVKAEPR